VTIPRFLRRHRTVLALKMDSRTLQLETGSRDVVDAETRLKFVVNAETDGEPQHASEFDGAGQTFTCSKEQARVGDTESGSVAVQADQKSENDDGPKGIRFALLFTCILLGSFFIGYVRADPSQERCPS
jgi:hypothetical protein